MVDPPPGVNIATRLAVLLPMSRLQMLFPAQAPLQPANVQPGLATALSCTKEPATKLWMHVPLEQRSPAGALVTVPLPERATDTDPIVAGADGAAPIWRPPFNRMKLRRVFSSAGSVWTLAGIWKLLMRVASDAFARSQASAKPR